MQITSIFSDTDKRPPLSHVTYLLLIACLILTCYSNAFFASWHLDDRPNITANSSLHIDNLSFTTLSKTLTANPTSPGSLYRPIVMLTFAINWYISKDNIFSYHIFNISIHIITAIFLYLTIFHILTKTYYSTQIQYSKSTTQLVAFFAVLLWALHPIQTQAITYIVQRMASMTAMFYIIAIFFYLLARHTSNISKKIGLFTIVFFAFCLAIGSKENSITLPITLILVEFLFLQNIEKKKVKLRFSLILFGTTALFFLFGSIFFLNGEPLSILNAYNARSFTLTERLLTEPRVVTNYLYQIFYPITSSLSFEHDTILSKSLLEPWTTLPAIFFLTFLLISAFFSYRKSPFYSFAILFFFLNHLIESTVIPLELTFEHRNYLPSMFLFIPVAQILFFGIKYFQKINPLLSRTIIVFSISLLFILGFGTYSRNTVWATEQTLWEDTLKKAPKSARAAHNLGRWYRQHGQLDEALDLFMHAEQVADYSAKPNYTKANALNGQGTIFYYTDGPERAIKAFRAALTADPSFEASQKNLAVTLLKSNQWPEALQETTKLTNNYPNIAEYLYFHAIALLRNDQTESSLVFLETARRANPEDKNLLLADAAAHKILKQFQKAKSFLYEYDKIDPGKLSVGLTLLEISIIEQDNDTTATMVRLIQQKYTTEELAKTTSGNQFIPLYSKDIIATILKQNL